MISVEALLCEYATNHQIAHFKWVNGYGVSTVSEEAVYKKD